MNLALNIGSKKTGLKKITVVAATAENMGLTQTSVVMVQMDQSFVGMDFDCTDQFDHHQVIVLVVMGHLNRKEIVHTVIVLVVIIQRVTVRMYFVVLEEFHKVMISQSLVIHKVINLVD